MRDCVLRRQACDLGIEVGPPSSASAGRMKECHAYMRPFAKHISANRIRGTTPTTGRTPGSGSCEAVRNLVAELPKPAGRRPVLFLSRDMPITC